MTDLIPPPEAMSDTLSEIRNSFDIKKPYSDDQK